MTVGINGIINGYFTANLAGKWRLSRNLYMHGPCAVQIRPF